MWMVVAVGSVLLTTCCCQSLAYTNAHALLSCSPVSATLSGSSCLCFLLVTQVASSVGICAVFTNALSLACCSWTLVLCLQLLGPAVQFICYIAVLTAAICATLAYYPMATPCLNGLYLIAQYAVLITAYFSLSFAFNADLGSWNIICVVVIIGCCALCVIMLLLHMVSATRTVIRMVLREAMGYMRKGRARLGTVRVIKRLTSKDQDEVPAPADVDVVDVTTKQQGDSKAATDGLSDSKDVDSVLDNNKDVAAVPMKELKGADDMRDDSKV